MDIAVRRGGPPVSEQASGDMQALAVHDRVRGVRWGDGRSGPPRWEVLRRLELFVLPEAQEPCRVHTTPISLGIPTRRRYGIRP